MESRRYSGGASAREVAVRIVNMTRFLNLQMGAGPDFLPERFFKPVRFEDREYVLTREELENALRIYYELRGWDGEGRPLPETLRRLQLDFLTPQGV
ncbi:hypothetical protein ODS41_00270 [Pyrobaculum sp. 3827-6]|uniref:aldehyde ferredoxin oxidoreductase C-terminal domain-containing protein n=1 Tax=Pyrobaculum sp. 3827-6 TaxID=2983604 RepID=UPI0021DA7290|nr:aldehyde ferredoxin oxidoreductase C-terminal domain-containing protein [Pyrobaculum sp. 3827-6]MCU7786368.1 hypothetical protein [Pyrobaculum sp. 3827-6]